MLFIHWTPKIFEGLIEVSLSQISSLQSLSFVLHSLSLKRPSKSLSFSFLNNKYAFSTVPSPPVTKSLSKLQLLVCFLSVPFNKKGDDVTLTITQAKRLQTILGSVAKTSLNHKNLRNSLSGSTILICKNAFFYVCGESNSVTTESK